MADLECTMLQLNLDQYLDVFIAEGFDSWQTVLDITEADLESLGVKLGHRRKLQRAIADWRGVGVDESLRTSSARAPSAEEPHHTDRDASSGPHRADGRGSVGSGGKRKYRRHPKVDEHAPVRGPSAYVIFSNQIREELRSLTLSFTEIAKRVGERWQMLPPAGREPFEAQATVLKDRYHAELAEYKQTEQYRAYCEYLSDFKAKNGVANAGSEPLAVEGKRPKMGQDPAGRNSGESQAWDPMGSVGTPSTASAQNSPLANIPSPPALASHRSAALGAASPAPASPIAFGRHRPSLGGPGPSEASRNPPLPRIVPPERRDVLLVPTQLPPLLGEPGTFRGQANPRPSEKVFPAPFLRHDTSMSSRGSTKSSRSSSLSTAASSLTPATSIDEAKRHRALPPPPPAFAQPTAGSPYLDPVLPGVNLALATQPSSASGSRLSLALPAAASSPATSAAGRLSIFHNPFEPFPDGRHLHLHLHSPGRSASSSTPQEARPHAQHSDPCRPVAGHDRQAPMVRDDGLAVPVNSPLDILAIAGRLVGKGERDRRP